MEILKSHGTLFLAPICWSTFTLKYLRIYNDDESRLRITKTVQTEERVHKRQERHKKSHSISGANIKSNLKTTLIGYFGYLGQVLPQQARICLDVLWQHWNVSTLHHRALSLASFHLFAHYSSLSPPSRRRACHDSQSTHRCPAASLTEDRQWAVHYQRSDHTKT